MVKITITFFCLPVNILYFHASALAAAEAEGIAYFRLSVRLILMDVMHHGHLEGSSFNVG